MSKKLYIVDYGEMTSFEVKSETASQLEVPDRPLALGCRKIIRKDDLIMRRIGRTQHEAAMLNVAEMERKLEIARSRMLEAESELKDANRLAEKFGAIPQSRSA